MHQHKKLHKHKQILRYILVASLLTVNIKATIAQGFSQNTDTASVATEPVYPLKERNTYPFSGTGSVSPLLFPLPNNFEQTIVYDTETNSYIFSEKVGSINYRTPTMMGFEDFQEYELQSSVNNYWYEKVRTDGGTGPSFLKNLRLGSQNDNKVFGTDAITIDPSGSADLTFGYNWTRNDNPIIPIDNRKNGSFIFQENIEMNVTGKVGDKLELGLSYNTDATFEFENKQNLEYSGKEDEIIKKVEAGDVTFSVPGTLITGSQSLFGIKTELQFGKLTVSSVVSHQRGESSSINIQGGAQLSEFEVNADDYDVNRHFFLSHFFRDHYNDWLKNLPYIESQLQIEQIEVWVVNKQNKFEEAMNVVAFMDLGEGYGPDSSRNFIADSNLIQTNLSFREFPTDNDPKINNIYAELSADSRIRNLSTIDNAIEDYSRGASQPFENGRDYIKIESARPLSFNDYELNEQLGYISLNSPLRNDEVLAVSFVYTYQGQTYQVGELSTNITGDENTLIAKMLKGTSQSPKFPNWDLMMKNVYSLGAYQVSRDGFVLNVLYRDDKTGSPVNFIAVDTRKDPIAPEANKTNLLKVMELDNLDSRNEPNPDGIFDFVEGITIDSRRGRIIFPVIEPFGSDLRDKITGGRPRRDILDPLYNPKDEEYHQTADKFVFEELYDSTQTSAEQMAEKNKFLLSGFYKSSSSSEIYLNAMNIPRGSVVVTSGGTKLTEGQDYTVDYTLGRVKILNEGYLQSGTPIKISLESNSLFALQTKTFLGTHLNYQVSENFNIGGTFMRLTETPLTPKVGMGDEPISNTMFGLNTSYRTESQFLTTLIDKLPLIETKQPSSIAINAEVAYLRPGQSRHIRDDNTDQSVAYIDDFEGAQTKINMREYISWHFSSIPQGQAPGEYFPASTTNDLELGYKRGKITWFRIDPIFYGRSKPSGVRDEDLESHLMREVKMKELFPEKDDDISGFETPVSMLNVVYYPHERGIYNYNPALDGNGMLNPNIGTWGGIMRAINTTDFETSNIEYIEFWLMDPYVEENGQVTGGDMYFHLGEISEDIVPDSRKSFENGLPSTDIITDVDTTAWGIVPRGQAITTSFSNDPQAREKQDVGLDGLSDEREREFFKDFLSEVGTNNPAFEQISGDPSADNFEYFINSNHSDNQHSIIRRYKNFNGLEGNSPASQGSQVEAARSDPDIEDINGDKTLNTTETYYEYRVSLRPEDFKIGQNYIVDEKVVEADNNPKPVTWYQFRIPIDDYSRKIGEISDFRSVRFMRMVYKDFTDTVVCRFATLDLVRSEWRRYKSDLNIAGVSTTLQKQELSNFEVSAVNIEENSEKVPINYVLPPGVNRETDVANTQYKELNEQSLLIKVENLEENDARAVFKNTDLDLRQYKHMEMFIHAESVNDEELQDGEVSAILRIGSDYVNNYYEYEIPLEITKLSELVQNQSNDTSNNQLVWKNFVDINLQDFIDVKKERNRLINSNPAEYSLQKPHTKIVQTDNYYGTNKDRIIRVKGNPNLAEVRQIMLGVRNPNDEQNPFPNDGYAKSVEVWFNELRLTEFNNKGGGAANGSVQIQLADLGVVNLAGATSEPGFGGIEQKVDERQKEQINQYDINSSIELGKLFPEKAQVSMPMYVGVSTTIINPEYYPKDPDIRYKDYLKANPDRKDEIKRESQDYTSRRSFNITNIRWNKNLKKAKLVSPKNLSATITYTETNKRNYNLEYDNFRRYGGNLGYRYSVTPKNIKPFDKTKSKVLRKPSMRIIRDINFNPHPSSFSMVNSFNRTYQESRLRDINNFGLPIDSTVSKDFSWVRNYNLSWDLTQKLQFKYSATNNARITEPNGAFDLFEDDDKYYNDVDWKDSVWSSIINYGGKNMTFDQKFDLSYTLPTNKIPLLNWTDFKASYNSSFYWTRGPEFADPLREPAGHNLRNSSSLKLSGNFNMRNLYNKVSYFKKLDSKYRAGARNKKVEFKTVTYEKRTFLNANRPRTVSHNLKTTKVEVKVVDADNNPIEAEVSIIDENKVAIQHNEDLRGITVIVEGQVEKKENPVIFIAENTIRAMLGIKSISASYTRSGGTVLPGYLPETKMLGFNTSAFNDAPGWPFVLGYNTEEYPMEAARKGWLTQDTLFSQPIVFNITESFSVRTTFEPFSGFRIDLNAKRDYGEQKEQYYYYHDQQKDNFDRSKYVGNHYFDNLYKGGNYSISIISIKTAFEGVKFWQPYNKNNDNYYSEAFDELKKNRYTMLERLNSEYPIPLSDTAGYTLSSPEVLIPSFYAAYTGSNPNKVTINNFFHWFMLPNWRLTFNGLTKVDFFKQYFKSININHSYRSTYSIGSFATNVLYEDINDNRDFPELVNGYSKYIVGNLNIREDFGPLIGFDMTWINSLKTSFKINQSRNLSLSTKNNKLTETKNKDFVIGAGYRVKDVPLSITTSTGRRQFKSDLNIKFDVTIRDNITVIRALTERPENERTDVTIGTRKLVFGLTADYVFTKNFNMQFYTDWTKNSPYTTEQFPNQEFSIGLTLRLSL